jgi:hypothetical protein
MFTMIELHSLLLSHETRFRANLTTTAVHLANSHESSSPVPASAFYAGISQPRFSSSHNSTSSSVISPSPSDYFPISFHNRGRENTRECDRGRFSDYNSDKPQCQISLRKGHTQGRNQGRRQSALKHPLVH